MYVAETISHLDCGGISVTRRHQFITSETIRQSNCGLMQDTHSKTLTFKADVNMKIKFTFTRISGAQVHNGNNTQASGYIADGTYGNIAIQMNADGADLEVVTHNSHVDLGILDASDIMLLIRFQGMLILHV